MNFFNFQIHTCLLSSSSFSGRGIHLPVLTIIPSPEFRIPFLPMFMGKAAAYVHGESSPLSCASLHQHLRAWSRSHCNNVNNSSLPSGWHLVANTLPFSFPVHLRCSKELCLLSILLCLLALLNSLRSASPPPTVNQAALNQILDGPRSPDVMATPVIFIYSLIH